MVRLCGCGCGEPAPIAKANHRAKGHVKGEPVRFVNGHAGRGVPKSPETRERMAAYASNRTPEHHARLVAAARARGYTEDASYSSVHAWLGRHHPKSGECEACGRRGKTDYAFKRHPAPYTRDRADYAELCRSCHVLADYASGARTRRVTTAA